MQNELVDFGSLLYIPRNFVARDDIVIYTGYTMDELSSYIPILQQYPNIIIKFGRYVPNSIPIYDDILGVTLASNNQYAVKIS